MLFKAYFAPERLNRYLLPGRGGRLEVEFFCCQWLGTRFYDIDLYSANAECQFNCVNRQLARRCAMRTVR